MHYYLYQITNLVNNKIYVGVHKTKSLDVMDLKKEGNLQPGVI